jgi:hypothetical protein
MDTRTCIFPLLFLLLGLAIFVRIFLIGEQ